jgi:hypothetical protein
MRLCAAGNTNNCIELCEYRYESAAPNSKKASSLNTKHNHFGIKSNKTILILEYSKNGLLTKAEKITKRTFKYFGSPFFMEL